MSFGCFVVVCLFILLFVLHCCLLFFVVAVCLVFVAIDVLFRFCFLSGLFVGLLLLPLLVSSVCVRVRVCARAEGCCELRQQFDQVKNLQALLYPGLIVVLNNALQSGP